MRINNILWAGIIFSGFGNAIATVQSTIGPAGFTGYAITPNAKVLNWGDFSFTYDNQLPGIIRRPEGHNLVGAFGLLPNLEISGRIATNEVNSNCYISCGARDLSGSGKFGIGIDAAGRFSVAVGATDLGGKVSYFNSYYGVATYSGDVTEVSLGLAKRGENGIPTGAGTYGSQSPLNGFFGSAAYQPFPWLQANIEYSDKNSWGGVKVFMPSEYLPKGWRAYVGANLRLNNNRYTERSWFTAGLSIPLYHVPDLPSAGKKVNDIDLRGAKPLPVYEALIPAPAANRNSERLSVEGSQVEPVAKAASSYGSVPKKPVEIDDEKLAGLADKLAEKGFEDIFIGKKVGGAVAVKVNNATYNWNSLDALGVALGVIAKEFESTRLGYSLILTQRQLPLVAVSGQLNCLYDWIYEAGAVCTAGQLLTPGSQALESLQDNVKWIVEADRPSWKTIRLGLSPVINSAVATEYGLLDYSFGVRAAVSQPLWAGAVAEVRQIIPVDNSDDYRQGRVYGASRLKNVTDRAIISQAIRIPLEQWLPISSAKASQWGLASLTAQGTVGRINEHYDGVHGELRWEPGEGHHRFGIEGGQFKNAEFAPVIYGPATRSEPKIAKPVIASYRYAYAPTRTYFDVSAGQYMYNDRGFYTGMTQWFGDVAVSLYYRQTKYETERVAKKFVGIQFSVPIGPRKDMSPTSHIQVTGSPRVGYGVETLVRASTLNYITLGHGVLPSVPVLNDVFNSDRSGLIYFEDNMRRIRDAARS